MKKNSVAKRITGIVSAAVIAATTMTTAAVSVSAAGPNNNLPVVYFEPCGNWGECGAQMKAYFFNNDSNNFREVWKDMKQVDGKLYTEAPYGYDTVVFTRNNPDTNEIWNQTYDLTVEPGNTFKATEFEGKYYKGEWKNTQSKQEEPKSESKVTNQVTFVPSNEWKSDGARFMVYAYNKDTNENAWITPGKRSAEASNYIANVPDKFTHVVFVRLPGNSGNSFDEAWNKTPDINVKNLIGKPYTVYGWALDKYEEGKNTNLY